MRKSQTNHTLSELLTLRKAVEKSGEVIFMTDREGIITYVNPEFCRLYGFNAPEVIGQTTPRILKSGSMSRQDYEIFWETLFNRQIVRGEFINKCKDGSQVIVEGSANPILDENGDIIGFLAIQRDITLRKQAEQALKDTLEFQQLMLDGIDDPLMVIEHDYKVTAANKAARKFPIGNEESSEPIYCYQMSHCQEVPCDGIEHPCPFQKVRKSGRPMSVVHQHYQANGSQRLVEVVASPLRYSDGSIRGIIESMRDITAHRQAEQASLEYAERLKILAAKLTVVEESERQRLARELHDQVGQNLTALGINLKIIQMQIPDEMLDSINFHLEDSLSLVDQIAERMRDVMADLRPPVLDDYGLVAALRWYGEKISHRTGIQISVEGFEPYPRLELNTESALFRIVQEALTNVAKHSQASFAKISVVEKDEAVSLFVEDDGIGFDPEAGIQDDTSQGWGLLTMTERAEAVGGLCKIESHPDQGTRVSIEIPK